MAFPNLFWTRFWNALKLRDLLFELVMLREVASRRRMLMRIALGFTQSLDLSAKRSKGGRWLLISGCRNYGDKRWQEFVLSWSSSGWICPNIWFKYQFATYWRLWSMIYQHVETCFVSLRWPLSGLADGAWIHWEQEWCGRRGQVQLSTRFHLRKRVYGFKHVLYVC